MGRGRTLRYPISSTYRSREGFIKFNGCFSKEGQHTGRGDVGQIEKLSDSVEADDWCRKSGELSPQRIVQVQVQRSILISEVQAAGLRSSLLVVKPSAVRQHPLLHHSALSLLSSDSVPALNGKLLNAQPHRGRAWSSALPRT